MKSIKQQARFAGLLYLLASIPAPFGLIYVPSTLIVTGDAAATADRVRLLLSSLCLQQQSLQLWPHNNNHVASRTE
jgi:hypothetical protein